jgi:hypothetical protein
MRKHRSGWKTIAGLGAAFLLIAALAGCDLLTPAFSKNLDNPADPSVGSVPPAPTGLSATVADGEVTITL